MESLEPELAESVRRCMQDIQDVAERGGHALGPWKWDRHDCWRAWCENRSCVASIWVTNALDFGGIALNSQYRCGARTTGYAV